MATQTKREKIPINKADPPPEIKEIVGCEYAQWYSHPNLLPIEKRLHPRDLQTRQIDAYGVMQPFLGNPVLDGTLRTMDIANGCGQQCDTCFTDAVYPSSLFSLDSLDRLFATPEFLRMLQPSFRVGSTGDIVDHPQTVDIAQMIVERTASLGIAVKIWTNYRKLHEEKLVRLIELANRIDGRLRIIISLPNNRVDTVSKQFRQFAAKHAALLQWEPHKLRNPFRFLTTFAHTHPEILESVTPVLRAEFVEYMMQSVEENDISSWQDKPYTKADIETLVSGQIEFLPTYIKERGGIEKYKADVAQMVKEDDYARELHPGRINNPHVSADQDVRSIVPLYAFGRMLPERILFERGQLHKETKVSQMIREVDFESRGLCKTLFNPDALWLHLYATPVESHTCRVYTPITTQNLAVLSRIPFHPDFPAPPHWPGGRGKRQSKEYELARARKQYQSIKQKMIIVD
jgi:hypothetical protein